jgi:hypothetical protein
MRLNPPLDPDSPDYCIAAGSMGMDALFSHPFKPFIIVFFDMIADRSAPRSAYKILDPRAVQIEKFGANYNIGLAVSDEKGVKDTFSSMEVSKIWAVEELAISFPVQDGWYAWAEIKENGPGWLPISFRIR